MNLKQVQIQTQANPTAAELIKEIAETYVNERGWADVMEILPILYGEIGLAIANAIHDEMQKQALQDKHCPYDGEELKCVVVEGYRNWRCPKCWEIWQEGEAGQQ